MRNKNNNDELSVEVLFQGNIEGTIDGFSQDNKVATFKRYMFGTDEENLRVKRATPNNKALMLWSEEEGEFKNETGIDAPAKKLFETNFVWADTNPNNELSFGASTICGNLLKEIANNFKETDKYREFAESFHNTFNDINSELRQALTDIEVRTQQIFEEQFGNAGIKFKFNELDIGSFFKKADVEVDDGVNTPIIEKGSGMQRAIALAMLQVYAEELIKHDHELELKKPFFLFIDEPEVCLHPKAQEKLLSALVEISRTNQIFVATHSPFFLASPYLHNIGLFIFEENNSTSSITKINSSQKLLPWSPTWGEINFKAFNLPTVEFHDELYGRLQEVNSQYRINDFDNWLENQGLQKIKSWTEERAGIAGRTHNVTLQTFIRHKVHHPENTTMQSYNFSHDELRQSIDELIQLLDPP